MISGDNCVLIINLFKNEGLSGFVACEGGSICIFALSGGSGDLKLVV